MEIESHLEQLQQVFQWQRVQHPTHHQRHRKVHDLLREQQVGAGAPGEGTHFRGLHREAPRFHPVLLVGGVEDLITSVTVQSHKSGFVHREGKAPMGRASSSHQIYATVNNHQEEHQSTMVESSGMLNHVNVKILFDYGATDSFISPCALEKCGLEAYEHDDFKQVEMASGEKQAVGPSIDNCLVDLGVCTTRLKVYVTALGTYDLIIGMDWLESHRAMVDCFAKRVLCVDDEGRSVEIHGVQRKVSLCFISTMKVKHCMRQGCRLYVVEAVNEGKGPSMDQYPVLSEFKDVFPKELSRVTS
jgi:predicted aspartyl protease